MWVKMVRFGWSRRATLFGGDYDDRSEGIAVNAAGAIVVKAYEWRQDVLYGPYIKHGRVNATVPQDYDPAVLTLEQALAILEAKKQASSGKDTKAKGKSHRATQPDEPERNPRRAAVPVQTVRKSGKSSARATAARSATRTTTRRKTR
jgi:topoisomerase IA-like protein